MLQTVAVTAAVVAARLGAPMVATWMNGASESPTRAAIQSSRSEGVATCSRGAPFRQLKRALVPRSVSLCPPPPPLLPWLHSSGFPPSIPFLR